MASVSTRKTERLGGQALVLLLLPPEPTEVVAVTGEAASCVRLSSAKGG